MFLLFVPIFVTIIFYVFYTSLLKKVNGETLFCDLGFIYSSLLVLYTVIPGLVLVYGLTKPGDPIAVMLDTMSITVTDLSIHLWRHFLFLSINCNQIFNLSSHISLLLYNVVCVPIQ